MSNKKNHTTQKYKPETAPIVYEDKLETNKTEEVVSTNVAVSSGENVELGETEAVEAVQKETPKTMQENVDNKEFAAEPKKTCSFNEDFLNKTLVSVRITGDKSGRNGVHAMCIANLAKVIITNTDVDRVILVNSRKTADAIYDLIVDYPEKINATEMSRETRLVYAEKFWNDLIRYRALQ